MTFRTILQASTLAAALVPTPGRALESFFLDGLVSFEQIRNPGFAAPEVGDALRALIPDGTRLVARVTVDPDDPDADPDPRRGFYPDAVASTRMRVGGFDFPESTGFCGTNANCALLVRNDQEVVPGFFFDSFLLLTQSLPSPDIGAAVAALSGITPATPGGFPVPVELPAQVELSGGGEGLLDDDGFFDPTTAPSGSIGARLTVSVSSNWNPSEDEPGSTRYDFIFTSLAVGTEPPPSGDAQVPLPGAAGLLGFGAALLSALRRRRTLQR